MSLKIIKRIIITLFIIVLFFIVFLKIVSPFSVLELSGDEKSVYAEIYINGKKKSIFEKHVDIDTKKIFGYAKINVQGKKIKLKVINVDNKILEKYIDIKGENYIYVDFKNMVIKN
ncbi:MAG: hypothetical protein A2539_06420 [Elusimicrobia bacterium RIFOXYD2_FULL_34_15]|nr:MAG: hypothetical protein A2539_06420 [Elusimicrobia bacterium RIFOXYD2_FULL_34_15]HAM38463.1 hypothetical protein [Elusimicrobiota bacterium]